MKTDELLSALKTVEEISADLRATSWVWGGLTADIYTGRLMREHDDLDYLTLNLHDLAGRISSRFRKAGWSVERLATGDLCFERGACKIRLGHISLSPRACWTHNGEHGCLFFPAEWLVPKPRRFYENDLHVVAPELQYALLDRPQLLNPDWAPRPKDLAAKACLGALLQAAGTDLGQLEDMIQSQEI